jgi:hypothetical protein
MMSTAARSKAIVSWLFPNAIRKRLMEDSDGTNLASQNNRLKSFLRGKESGGTDAKPIADLFPHTTVMFAEIAGFMAW